MKKMLFLTLAVLLLPIVAFAGEIVFGWNLKNETGKIYDMQFMPDKDYFILSSATDLQIRKTETGELVKSFPFGAYEIEFTPEGSRMFLVLRDTNNLPPIPNVLGRPNIIQVRTINDMNLIKEYNTPPGTDMEGLGEIYQGGTRIFELSVDPVRPLLYVLRTTSGTISGGRQFNIDKVVVYNYETMQEVKELISFVNIQNMQSNDEYFNDYINYRHLAVSNDGKYLALLSEGEAHIRVWDLQTLTLKNEFKLCDEGSDEPVYIKFSEKNTDIIYFTGEFPPNGVGFFTYNIKENKLIEPIITYPEYPTFSYGNFTFFWNEEKMLYVTDLSLRIIVLKNKNIEYEGERKPLGKPISYGDLFLGFGGARGEYFTMAKYNSETTVESELERKHTIYPNPTNGIINIPVQCEDAIRYEIFDANGRMLFVSSPQLKANKMLTIDFSKYPAGAYSIKLFCGKNVTQYKVVKEG